MKTNLRIASLSLLAFLCLALSLPALATDLYDNGPSNFSSNAYFIDVYQVSDSFVPVHRGDITSFTFGEWVPSGATPLTVDWAISTHPLDGNIGPGGLLASGMNAAISAAPVSCGSGFGYDCYDSTVSVGSIPVRAGATYWLTLWGATDNFGGRDAWDVNSGPSMAFHNLLGKVPSESFTLNGTTFAGNAPQGGNTPEPSSIALFGSGVVGLAGVLRRKLSP